MHVVENLKFTISKSGTRSIEACLCNPSTLSHFTHKIVIRTGIQKMYTEQKVSYQHGTRSSADINGRKLSTTQTCIRGT